MTRTSLGRIYEAKARGSLAFSRLVRQRKTMAGTAAEDAGSDSRLARLSVDQYDAMVAGGILRDGEPIELVDGVLVYKHRGDRVGEPMTIGKKHNLVVKLIARLDPELAKRACHLQTQGPVSLPPDSEPEPDGAVLKGDPRDYADRLPGAADVHSVIEVAGASLETDRTIKLATYARAGIPQYVIVNLQEACVEVYEQPEPKSSRYGRTAIYRAGESFALKLDGERLDVLVDRILP